MGAHLAVATDGQHKAEFFQTGAQVRVGAVDLVSARPSSRHSGGDRTGDHGCGQGGFGREVDLVGDSGRGAPVGVLGPAARQVERAVDQGVPGPAGVGEIDRDLGVLDPAGGAGVLTLHRDGALALLQITGLVDHQDRVGFAEVINDVVAQVGGDTVGVPARPVQQVLHAVRSRIPSMFGDGPAVPPRQVSNHAAQQAGKPAAGFDPAEPSGHPTEQLIFRSCEPSNLYAVARGHRTIRSPHNRG